jgi:hypothetical protein
MGWIIALLGLIASIAGGGAIYLGWPMVPLERGWTLVIAGAALGSGGLISLAIAAQIFETRRLRLAFEKTLTRLAAPRDDDASAPAAPAHKRGEASGTPRSDAGAPLSRSEPEMGDEMQPARSFTVGETTFVVFTDGSIEAQTAEGNKRFRSMEEVRAYLETAVS